MTEAVQEKSADLESGAIISLPDSIELIIGYGEYKFKFKFKMLTLEQERSWLNWESLKAESQAKDPLKDYASVVSKMAEVSIARIKAKNAKGEWVDVVENISDPVESFNRFFKEYSAAKERLVTTLFVEYREAMVPSKSFL